MYATRRKAKKNLAEKFDNKCLQVTTSHFTETFNFIKECPVGSGFFFFFLWMFMFPMVVIMEFPVGTCFSFFLYFGCIFFLRFI